MYERLICETSQRNFLIYPYAHTWRHCIELQLKATLPIVAELHAEELPEDLKETHNLAKLWSKARPLIEKTFPTTRRADFTTVTKVIGQLTALDPDGQNFRYHVRKDGTPVLSAKESIDLPKFHEALQGVCAFFDGAAMGAHEDLETQREITREYTP